MASAGGVGSPPHTPHSMLPFSSPRKPEERDGFIVSCLGGVGVLLSCDKGPDHRPPQPVSFPELCGWVMAWTTWRQQWERGAALSPQGMAGAWCPGPCRASL